MAGLWKTFPRAGWQDGFVCDYNARRLKGPTVSHLNRSTEILMRQQLVELERIHFARVLPWIHLFRAFRLALDIRKIVLGGLALVLLYGGLVAFSYLPFDLSESELQSLRQQPWQQEALWNSPISSVNDVHWAKLGEMLAWPVITVLDPAGMLISQPLSWSGSVMRWTQVLWALCVWSFFGIVLSRMSAVQFAVDERVSVMEASKFGGSKWLWAISAPLMPIAGGLILWLFCVAGGWIGRIPAAGPVIVGLFWVIPILLGFAMLLLLIGLALGWPLMIATISTQGSDAFDGFSRSFDYVYSRFWHLMWFVFVIAIHGVLMLLIVTGAAGFITYLASTFIELGMGGEFGSQLAGRVPALFGAWEVSQPALESTFASQCVSVWNFVLMLLVSGYAVSYFWSASTIIYFLLRHSEDAGHLSEVYLQKTNASEDLLQLAGVAASDQPIVERPAKHDEDSRQDPSEGSATEKE